MNNPALKGEVSTKEKMLSQTSPGLRRNDVMFHSFSSCIADASEKLSRAPEMSMPEMPPQPWMLMQKFESTVTLEQLQSPANTHRRGQLDKQMDVINSDVNLINLTSISPSSRVENPLAINPHAKELHRVHRVFAFPDKMESILSEAMLPRFQIHFSSPKSATRDKAHANFTVYFEEPSIQALPSSQTKELNLMEDGDSSLL